MTDSETRPAENAYVDKQKVDMYMMSMQKYFPAEKIMFLKDKLYKSQNLCYNRLSFFNK